MTAPKPWEEYARLFRNSVEYGTQAGQPLLDQPGIIGRQGSVGSSDGRFLITDDRALPTLRALGDPRASIVNVHPDAGECATYLNGLGSYLRATATAMIARNLSALPEVAIDEALRIRRATAAPSGDDVSLLAAAAAGLAFDPGDDELTATAFAAYLGSIPNSALLVATDAANVVRATAGSAVFADVARVFFVSTDPTWRGRGVGTAMTVAALRVARDAGATCACLDSSDAGRGIYTRIGFETVGPITMFSNLG